VDVTRIALQKWLAWIATGLSAIALVVVAANAALFLDNQSRQAEVGQRQQVINQAVSLSQLNEALVRALAKQAIDNKDDKLLNLLAENGIGVTPGPAAAAPTLAPPSSAPVPPAKN
jgi:hypothetical protein